LTFTYSINDFNSKVIQLFEELVRDLDRGENIAEENRAIAQTLAHYAEGN
jgi:hypothetical protein